MAILNALRPARFRPVLTLVLTTILLAIVWSAFEIRIAYSLKPAVQDNYGKQLREEVVSWQDTEGENGWQHLVEAARAFEEYGRRFNDEATGTTWSNGSWAYATITEPEETRVLIHDTIGSDLSPDEADSFFETLREWAIDSVQSFATNGVDESLDRLLAADYVLCEIADSSLESQRVVRIQLTPMRGLVAGMQARLVLSAQRGDWADYCKACEYGLAIGWAVRYQPGGLNRLVGDAAHAELIELVSDHIREMKIPLTTMETLRAIVARYAGRPTPEQMYRSNELLLLNDMQYYFGKGGRLIMTECKASGSNGEKSHWFTNVQGLWKPRWSAFERAINKATVEYNQITRMSFREREDAYRQAREKSAGVIFDMSQPRFDDLRSFEEKWLDESIAYQLARQDLKADVLIDGLRLLLAVELFSANEGNPPQSLDELVPTYIDSIPIDPYDQSNNQWRYQRLEQPDESSRQFVLYSVGFDMTDNGGTRPRGYFTQGLDSYNDGMDFVISHPPLPESADE